MFVKRVSFFIKNINLLNDDRIHENQRTKKIVSIYHTLDSFFSHIWINIWFTLWTYVSITPNNRISAVLLITKWYSQKYRIKILATQRHFCIDQMFIWFTKNSNKLMTWRLNIVVPNAWANIWFTFKVQLSLRK